MPQLSFVTLDVFTSERFAGNPLAVVRVPDGLDVSTEQMQKIAREFNLSESVFLHDLKTGDDGLKEWRVRIFLTHAEVPFAGHPTIGSAVYALGTLSDSSSDTRSGRLLLNAGPTLCRYNPSTRVAKAEIAHDFHEHTQYPFTVEDVYALQPGLKGLGLSHDAIAVVSPVRGMNFTVCELPSLEALAAVSTSTKPSPKLDDEWNTGFTGSYYFVYTASPSKDANEVEQIVFQSRMIEGLFEDAATGSAGCGFACYAALKKASSRVTHFLITQGVEMGRKSSIEVTVTLTSDLKFVDKVELGGTAVMVIEGVVEYH